MVLSLLHTPELNSKSEPRPVRPRSTPDTRSSLTGDPHIAVQQYVAYVTIKTFYSPQVPHHPQKVVAATCAAAKSTRLTTPSCQIDYAERSTMKQTNSQYSGPVTGQGTT